MQELVTLYTKHTGHAPAKVMPLGGAASNRRYVRLVASDGSTLMGVVGESVRENQAFLALSRQMAGQGLRVPQVVAVSPDAMCYLQQDLGSLSLYDLIARRDAQVPALLEQVMRDLPQVQFLTAQGFDFGRYAVSVAEFGTTSIRWDLNYFKYCFLRLSGVAFDELALQRDFDAMETLLLDDADPCAFLYRDFQSRNVMVADGMPYYIDFQGGYRGPVYYDLASFLWQTRAAYPDTLRWQLADVYRQALQPFAQVEPEVFGRRLRLFALFRLLQTLGAYGFRGLYEHKVMFTDPICQTLAEVQRLLSHDDFGTLLVLRDVVARLAALPRFQPQEAGRLTVRITSFSYKRGIPEDLSGNGGGFVFDCRAPHNPGRYEQYKPMTGLDQPVIDFLEGNPEMPAFVQHVYGLVDPAVVTYLRRGFTSLVVNFGCTGGRHRSVYAAQHLADHLHALHPDLHIILTHREQNIIQEYA